MHDDVPAVFAGEVVDQSGFVGARAALEKSFGIDAVVEVEWRKLKQVHFRRHIHVLTYDSLAKYRRLWRITEEPIDSRSDLSGLLAWGPTLGEVRDFHLTNPFSKVTASLLYWRYCVRGKAKKGRCGSLLMILCP